MASSLCLFAFALAAIVRSPDGQPLAATSVAIRTAQGNTVVETVSAADGSVDLPDLPNGSYEAVVAGRFRTAFSLPAADRLAFNAEPPRTEITVTAERGRVVEAAESEIAASVHGRDSASRAYVSTIGQLLHGDSNVLVQQTSPAQVSPFLRGLTGYQVLNLVDGVRFNNATFRSGPNQYLAFVDPSQAERLEATLGPASTQYGSDALGGAIQVVTREARSGGFHGDATVFGATADLSGGADALLSYATGKFSVLGGAAGRRHNDLRAGGGLDSRHVFRRLFDLSGERIRELTGSRQQDTGFGQYAFHGRLGWRPAELHSLTAWYQSGRQEGVRNTKDLWGGLGRLQSDLTPQSLDLGYLRYEKLRAWFLDSLTGTVSLNSQRDGSVRQNLLASNPVTADRSRDDSFGLSAQGSRDFGGRGAIAFGGERYAESISSTRIETNPVSGQSRSLRPLYPDDSRYRTLGLFAQGRWDAIRNRLRLGAGARRTRASYSTIAGGFGTAASSQHFRDTTFHTSLLWTVSNTFGIHVLSGRGFRAPNASDLGGIGLNDLGYEIPARDAIAGAALLGSNAGEAAVSLGRALAPLRAETLLNHEAGFRFQTGRVFLRSQYFFNTLNDPLIRRTLLFDAARPPAALAGIPVRPIAPTPQQAAQGVVAVAPWGIDPRALKTVANDGSTRYHGLESMARIQASARLQMEANYSYILGRDLNPDRNVRRLPPQQGGARIRYARARWWGEISALAARAQTRLSGGDRDDERIGASRNAADIAAFFASTRNAPFVSGGRFAPTGETLPEIQARVLPGPATTVRAPLHASTAGWATLGSAFGFRLTETLSLGTGVSNLLDRNYRIHGSGADAAGVSAWASLHWTF